MLVVGLLVAGKSASIGDFAVTGRSMGLTVCSISIVATWFGAGPMMGSAAAAYSGDALLVLRDPIVSGVSLLIAGFFFARTYRRSKRMTHVEFYEARVGHFASVISALVNVVAGLLWLGGVLFAFGVVFETLTGQPAAIGLIGGTLVIVVYTMFGGLKAVAATDVLQMAFIVLGVFILFFVVLNDAGGWATVVQQLPAHAFDFSPQGESFADQLTYFQVWFSSGLVAISTMSVVQRSMAARTEQVAQNSLYIAGIVYLTFGLVPVTLGYIAVATMPGVEDPNAIIPLLAIEHLHPVLVAIFVGAVVSAIMSTSDSILLGIGTICSVNLLPRIVKNPSDKLSLTVARWSVPAMALIALERAFNTTSVIAAIGDAVSVGFAGMGGPWLLVIWWNKLTSVGGYAGIGAGFATFMASPFLFPDLPASLVAFVVSLAVSIIVSLATQKISPPKPLTNADEQPMDLSNRLGTLPLFRRVD
jgi:Na+/proline symporter